MEPLSLGASLPRIQDYVTKMETERGLDKQDLPSQCLKLGEEVGEMQGQPRSAAGALPTSGPKQWTRPSC